MVLQSCLKKSSSEKEKSKWHIFQIKKMKSPKHQNCSSTQSCHECQTIVALEARLWQVEILKRNTSCNILAIEILTELRKHSNERLMNKTTLWWIHRNTQWWIQWLVHDLQALEKLFPKLCSSKRCFKKHLMNDNYISTTSTRNNGSDWKLEIILSQSPINIHSLLKEELK